METLFKRKVPRCLFCREAITPENNGCAPMREDLPSFSLPYGRESQFSTIPRLDHCSTCGAKIGKLHHHGCDQAQCILCGHKLYQCSCVLSDYGEDLEDD
jgi:hypothetical protein